MVFPVRLKETKKHIQDWMKNHPKTAFWLSRKSNLYVLVGGVLFFIIILVLLFLPQTPASVIRPKWAVVQQGDFTVDLIESGDVEAVSQVSVSSPMMWEASKLQITDLIPEGTLVKKGDFLVQFDIADLTDSENLREKELASLLADKEKMKAQQGLTMSNMENNLRLTRYSMKQAQLRLDMRKFESDAKKEEARLQMKQAEIDLERSEKQVESQKIIHQSQMITMESSIRAAQNHLENARKSITRMTLTAPIDGMVVYQQVGRWNSRERLKSGYNSNPGEPLLSIPDLSRIQIKLYVNEADRLKINPGQSTVVVLDAYPDVSFKGKVREMSRLAQSVRANSKLKGFVVYVEIDGSDPRLKPGMTAQVRIELEKRKDAIFIPVGTVYEVEKQTVVFLKGKNKPYAVYLGPRNDGFVAVERGLKPGMKLAWSDPLEKALTLGSMEENRRIAEINKRLLESFPVFEKRGILYNYLKSRESVEKEKSSRSPKIDITKLPPTIRDRLKASEPAPPSGTPKVEVGKSDEKPQTGTFKVTPEMMNRLEKSKTPAPSQELSKRP
jgi:HlyD family secretion protein